jgi:septum formation protein
MIRDPRLVSAWWLKIRDFMWHGEMTHQSHRLILASASPRRAELLRRAGIAFDAHTADVDESPRGGESPEEYVRRIADDKARAAAATAPGRPILAADTAVVVDGIILGKPLDSADAVRMLRMLSGRTHQVMTGVTLIGLRASGVAALPTHITSPVVTEIAVTTVEFAALSDEEITWYVASGEPTDKAGSYAIQGLASRFITRIEGSYSNVVGLPVALVYDMCRRVGLLIS